ncbi:putative chloroperoxidase [Septoria linicola]|nr:putative chloroperoxidase [Septoria linicola]
MKCLAVLAGSLALTSAFPFALDQLAAESVATLEKRQSVPSNTPGSAAAKAFSRSRKHCGVRGCTTFDAVAQKVSVTGAYAYASPRPDQIRGPCPGLNAAANHGYIPRAGYMTIVETIDGLGAAYGMGVDLAGFLAAYAVIVDGDPRGPQPSAKLTKSLLGKPQGISYSHNNYEGDASIGRADAYLNNGDAHSLIISRFAEGYAATDFAKNGGQRNRYTLDAFAQDYRDKLRQSIQQNPYFLAAPFSGLVAPAAYNFVINFMSNHTKENPTGYFDGNQLKQFFGVTGNPGSFRWLKGQEKIPNNWYRRPNNPVESYNAADVLLDLQAQFLAYPYQVKFGGDTGRTNTFTGVDLSAVTKGADNGATLTQGNNLQCFFAQAAQAAISDLAGATLLAVNQITSQYFAPVTAGLGCPTVGKFDQTLFNKQ